MADHWPEFSELLEKAAKTAGLVLETAYQGLAIVERNVFEVLDKQIINRLLAQYDRLKAAGFTHEEALSAVIDLVRNRIETAIRERK